MTMEELGSLQESMMREVQFQLQKQESQEKEMAFFVGRGQGRCEAQIACSLEGTLMPCKELWPEGLLGLVVLGEGLVPSSAISSPMQGRRWLWGHRG